jgi:hypothetical protein
METIFGRCVRWGSVALAVAWLAGNTLSVWAQQPDPNAPAAPVIKLNVFGYFLVILCVALGLVVMLRPGSRTDPDAH